MVLVEGSKRKFLDSTKNENEILNSSKKCKNVMDVMEEKNFDGMPNIKL